MFRGVRYICKATSGSLDEELIGTDGWLQNIVSGDCLPVCVIALIWLWRDKHGNVTAETAAGLGLFTCRSFFLLLDRDLDLVIDLLG